MTSTLYVVCFQLEKDTLEQIPNPERRVPIASADLIQCIKVFNSHQKRYKFIQKLNEKKIIEHVTTDVNINSFGGLIQCT